MHYDKDIRNQAVQLFDDIGDKGAPGMDAVKNNNEKYQQYSKEFARLNKALNLGFYLEAVAIDYAIIEDRLVAFLRAS